jgi:hypothetical protein
MKHPSVFMLCILALIGLPMLAIPACAQPMAIVNVPLIPQQTNVWCWAASGEMVMQYFGTSVPQCEQATYQFGGGKIKANCCKHPTPKQCISGGQVEISHYGFTYQQLGGPAQLLHKQIEDQSANRHEPWLINPYCLNSKKCGNWGHVTVGVGYWATFGDSREWSPLFFIFINDPWPPNVGSFYMENYPTYRDGCWWGNGACPNGYAEGWDIYDIVPPKQIVPHVIVPEALPHLAESEARQALAGDPDPQRAAEAAWKVVGAAITQETAPRLGFPNPAAAREARLGHPIEQFDVGLIELAAWKPGEPVDRLLERMPSLVVPVEVAGHIHSTIRLRQQERTWKLSAAGSPQFAAAWEKAHASGGEFIVFVQGLELAFAGKRVNGKLHLISLFNFPEQNLREGEDLPAEQVLRRLVEAAATYRGNGATTGRQSAR